MQETLKTFRSEKQKGDEGRITGHSGREAYKFLKNVHRLPSGTKGFSKKTRLMLRGRPSSLDESAIISIFSRRQLKMLVKTLQTPFSSDFFHISVLANFLALALA
uniref:Uncharacterized protein n=1 Tax=Romanomermis culicivorax TaxID=13658 RepID=A0A915HXF5_ROMCU